MKRTRAITLLPALYKVYLRCLFGRIRTHVGFKLHPGTIGFRRSHQPAEVTGALRQAIEYSIEWEQPLYVAKLDIRKAFDRLQHHRIFESLRAYNGRGYTIGYQNRIRISPPAPLCFSFMAYLVPM